MLFFLLPKGSKVDGFDVTDVAMFTHSHAGLSDQWKICIVFEELTNSITSCVRHSSANMAVVCVVVV